MQSIIRPAQRLAFLVLLLATPILMVRPAAAQDASELLVRINRLETQVRQLQGSIEELQFQNRKLEDQLRKFQEDVEFRFQERSGGAKAPAASAPGQPAAPAPKPQKKSDAFDPSAQPDAPGAPKALGTMADLPQGAIPSGGADETGRIMDDGEVPPVLDAAPGEGPLDLSRMNRNAVPVAPLAPAATVVPPRQQPSSPTSQVAVAGSGNPRDQYDLAYGLVLQRQYEQAEMAFRQFLQTNPRDKLVPNATYWLGETYFRRSRYPDAVEQYLKIYKTFGTSKVAPDSMLRLALSLRGMGQPDQACATLAEIGRKYPDASTEVRTSVEREQKRGSC